MFNRVKHIMIEKVMNIYKCHTGWSGVDIGVVFVVDFGVEF